MSKFIAFVKFCAYILGAVGGFGYAVRAVFPGDAQ